MRTLTMEEVDRRAGRMYGFVAMIQMLFLITLLVALMSGVARADWTAAELKEYRIVKSTLYALMEEHRADGKETIRKMYDEYAVGKMSQREFDAMFQKRKERAVKMKAAWLRMQELFHIGCQTEATAAEVRSCIETVDKNDEPMDIELNKMMPDEMKWR
jgi:hypothetical protein